MDELANLNGLGRRQLSLSATGFVAEARAGRIPCLQVDKRLRFNVDAVRDALADRAAQTDVCSEAKP